MLSPTDERELAWWRGVFAARFRPGNLPTVGASLLSYQLTLMVEQHRDGSMVEWAEPEIKPGRCWACATGRSEFYDQGNRPFCSLECQAKWYAAAGLTPGGNPT